LISLNLNSNAKVFINGILALEVQTRSLFAFGSPNWDAASSLQLFSFYGSSYIRKSHPFTGKVHSLAIYDNLLSRDEIDDLFQSGRDQIIKSFFNRTHKLFAAPSNSYKLMQGRTFESPLRIGAEKIHMDGFSLAVSIVSLPSHGQLVSFKEERELLKVGSMVQMKTKENLISVYYLPSSKDYFNYPNLTADGLAIGRGLDSFEFVVLAFNSETKELLYKSKPATQYIQVVNTNHKPILVVPQHVAQHVVYDMGNSVASTKRPKIKIHGIKLIDNDLNIRRVRVDILTRNGTITLNKKHRYLADFECGSHYQFGWHCHGNGVNDRSVSIYKDT